jgi:arylsulfatase A
MTIASNPYVSPARRILSLFLLTTALALCSAKAVCARPPNIVFIVADDLGLGHLGCYGQEKIKTPNIDRLAAEGMRFTRFYSGGTVCAPSRSVLMTGLHTGHTPIRRNGGGTPLRDEDVTLAEVLKSAGYTTGGFGKWGLGTEETTGTPVKQGFDEFFGFLHQIHAHCFYTYWLSDNGNRFLLPENEGDKRGKYAHDVILARGLDFIRKSKDAPFFAYFPLTLPHVELTVPEDSMAQYRGKFPKVPLPDPRPDYIGSDDAYTTYAGMISRLDDGVGQIAALVKQLGLDDNTIIIFTSDNGAQAGPWSILREFFDGTAGLRGHKDNLYEGGIRIPLIARWPGKIKPGTTSDLMAGFQDMMPTFAELAGKAAVNAVPANTDGISFLPTLIGGEQDRRHEYLYWEHYTGKPQAMAQAVRAGDWKIMQSKLGQSFELYNLADDEKEKKNVAAEHPDIVKRLAALAEQAHTVPRNDPRVEKPVKRTDFVR